MRNLRPLFEKGVGKFEPRSSPCRVKIDSYLEKKHNGYYLTLVVFGAYIGRTFTLCIQEEQDAIIFGPDPSEEFMKANRDFLEDEAKRHFERIAHEYVNFDRKVHITIRRKM